MTTDSPVPPPEWTEEILRALAWAEGDERNRIIASVREGGYKDGFAAGSKAAVEKPDDRA